MNHTVSSIGINRPNLGINLEHFIEANAESLHSIFATVCRDLIAMPSSLNMQKEIVLELNHRLKCLVQYLLANTIGYRHDVLIQHTYWFIRITNRTINNFALQVIIRTELDLFKTTEELQTTIEL